MEIVEKLHTTVIISVYKDIEALELILDSLNSQTNLNFDILISEDCEYAEMKTFLKSYQSTLEINHIYQKDDGWQKNIALNNAIRAAKGEYLIFLDGDIVPYKHFIENHLKLASENKFLSGRRVELGPFFSRLVRKRYLPYRVLEKLYLFFYLFLVLDRGRHLEEGIYLGIGSFLEKKVNSKKDKKMMLVGCNFSCWKKDLETINGFDEDYMSPSVGEDRDLEWRFNHFGISYKSVRYVANTFHLYHARNWGNSLETNDKMMQEKIKKEEFRCKNGLMKEGIA
ncbi:MAG: glycosyltransferase [Sulfurovum sp.]|nr:glycosyltransferase [Sulfurovum sp.]